MVESAFESLNDSLLTYLCVSSNATGSSSATRGERELRRVLNPATNVTDEEGGNALGRKSLVKQ
jgi:hypothetical protein